MSVEVIAVRWECFSCEATAITAPEELPEHWYEQPPPEWRPADKPRHYCPEHAAKARRIQRGREARFAHRVHEVSVAEYESTKALLALALRRLEQLRYSGQRAGDP